MSCIFTCYFVDTGMYALVEGSRGEFFSDAKLQSPALPASSNVCFLSFLYNLNSKNSGVIRLTAKVRREGNSRIGCLIKQSNIICISF